METAHANELVARLRASLWENRRPPVSSRGQVAIHDHRHFAQYATARLERLQSRIDRLNGVVDGLTDVRDHESLRRPLHRQSHPRWRKACASLSCVAGSEK